VSTGVPEGLRERVAAWQAGRLEVAAPRDAATVILLRDTPAGLEVLLLRRAASLAFAGGRYVFPGGTLAPGDERWQGPLPPGWAELLGSGDDRLARAVVGAAVRETAEECGVWLGGCPAPPGPPTVEGLPLGTDLLRPWAHWITPEFEPRRYDTRFLVAAVPDGQQPRSATGETDDARWVRPAHADRLAMLPPTAHTLGELAGFDTVAQVLATAREIRPVRPVAAVVDGEIRLLMPWHAEYPRP
jgi:8-oxo-dGTP pyrophosphatase MutT (NUDIX family)